MSETQITNCAEVKINDTDLSFSVCKDTIGLKLIHKDKEVIVSLDDFRNAYALRAILAIEFNYDLKSKITGKIAYFLQNEAEKLLASSNSNNRECSDEFYCVYLELINTIEKRDDKKVKDLLKKIEEMKLELRDYIIINDRVAYSVICEDLKGKNGENYDCKNENININNYMDLIINEIKNGKQDLIKNYNIELIAHYILVKNIILRSSLSFNKKDLDDAILYRYNYDTGVFEEVTRAFIDNIIADLTRFKPRREDERKIREVIVTDAYTIDEKSFFYNSSNLIAFTNGVYDINNKVLLEKSPVHKLAKHITPAFNFDFKDIGFEEFKNTKVFDIISECLNIEKQGLNMYINEDFNKLMLILAMLAGRNTKKQYFIFAGLPNTCKTTTINILTRATNDVTFKKAKDLESRFGLADLKYKHIIAIDEANNIDNDIVNLIKTISGRAPIPIERKYKDIEVIENRHNIILTANKLPLIDLDQSMLKRMFILEFKHVIQEDKIVKDIDAIISTEDLQKFVLFLIKEYYDEKRYDKLFNSQKDAEKITTYLLYASPFFRFIKENYIITSRADDYIIYEKLLRDEFLDAVNEGKVDTFGEIYSSYKKVTEEFNRIEKYLIYLGVKVSHHAKQTIIKGLISKSIKIKIIEALARAKDNNVECLTLDELEASLNTVNEENKAFNVSKETLKELIRTFNIKELKPGCFTI